MSKGGRTTLSLTVLASVGAALVFGGAAIGAGLFWVRPQLAIISGERAAANATPAIARRLIVYRLDPQQPTVFRFTQPTAQARIVAHPALSPGAASPGKGFVYAYRAELLDSAGEVIGSHVIHALSLPVNAKGKREGGVQFYRDSPLEVGPGDEARIAADRPFAGVRLFTAPSDPGVVHIDVSTHEHRPLTASAARSAFYRLSPDDQQRLAGPNAFPAALLTDSERASIAINQWRPVGPVGIDGRDHVMAVLYETKQPEKAGPAVDREEKYSR